MVMRSIVDSVSKKKRRIGEKRWDKKNPIRAIQVLKICSLKHR